MKKYNPKIHHRKSIRLKGYDYARVGLYFVTICVQDRACLFGDIMDGELRLNDAGIMIEKWYYELEHKFPDIKCGSHVVMPNHFHCVIHNVGADLRVCPDNNGGNCCGDGCPDGNGGNCCGCCCDGDGRHPDNGKLLNNDNGQTRRSAPTGSTTILGEHVGSPLHRVVQWFKTMTTNEYIRNVKTNNWQRFNGKLWQRNYWEHIIRNEKSHQNIAQYILNNPLNWKADQLKPK